MGTIELIIGIKIPTTRAYVIAPALGIGLASKPMSSVNNLEYT